MILQIIFNVFVLTCTLLIVAMSFSLIYITAKFFHIAHAAIITMAAYFVYSLIYVFSIPFAYAVIVGILAVIVVGVLCELLIYRPMRKRSVSSYAYLISSIGLYIILQNTISLFFGDDTKVINTAELTVGHQIFGAYITTVQIIIICISLVLFVGVNIFLNITRTGKSIRSVSDNPELCNIYGISSKKIILIAFALGSALAAVAGILSAMDTNMNPTFGFNLLLYGVVAMIIGGVGNTRGLFAGSLLVATSQNLAAVYLDTKWMDAITYIILILFLIWRPLGFSGNHLKKVEV